VVGGERREEEKEEEKRYGGDDEVGELVRLGWVVAFWPSFAGRKSVVGHSE
jgi:hypothetical protein